MTPGERAAERRTGRAGRNLPLAVAVGLGLGALVLVTLYTVAALFLIVVAAAVALATAEIEQALRTRRIGVPLPVVVAGGMAMLAAGFWLGPAGVVATLAGSLIAVFVARLPGGTDGYVRDVTGAAFVLLYVPFLASFVALMLAPEDGRERVITFIVVTICSDIGGYFAGILLGRHPLAPTISPKKTWEGFAGSALGCVVAGAVMLPWRLDGELWHGVLVGLAAVCAATLGDLAESMVKRDLGIKDMGRLLPGHGGMLDRIDSLLATAPVIWLLLEALIPS